MLNRLMYLTVIVAIAASSVYGQSTQWIRQFGTAEYDGALSVSADGLGSIYVSGQQHTAAPNPYASYGFLSKLDASGATLWMHSFDAAGLDTAVSVSADKLGNVFVVGQSPNSIGGSDLGAYDLNLNKYDANGNLVWARQYGGATTHEEASRVAADGLGNAYVAGIGPLYGPNLGMFLGKYDTSGNLVWGQQLEPGTVNGLSVDGVGNVYVAGVTNGSLGGPNAGYSDAFVRKYDSSGNLLWTRQVGTNDYENGGYVATDTLGNVFFAGATYKSLAGPLVGFEDAFLYKYDASGNLIWSQQFGGWHQTHATDIYTDGAGNVFVAGETDGLTAVPENNSFDAFLRKYDGSGTMIWSRQFGTADLDTVRGVTADQNGGVYITGATNLAIGASSAGGADAYVIKVAAADSPEPGSLGQLCAMLAGLGVFFRKRVD